MNATIPRMCYYFTCFADKLTKCVNSIASPLTHLDKRASCISSATTTSLLVAHPHYNHHRHEHSQLNSNSGHRSCSAVGEENPESHLEVVRLDVPILQLSNRNSVSCQVHSPTIVYIVKGYN